MLLLLQLAMEHSCCCRDEEDEDRQSQVVVELQVLRNFEGGLPSEREYSVASCTAGWRCELCSQIRLGFPIFLSNLADAARCGVTIRVLWMNKDDGVAAAGTLGVAFANITGYSMIRGMAKGMEPHCSYAFGARNSQQAAETLWRMVIILLVACIPVAFLWINSAKLLSFFFMFDDPKIMQMVSKFVILSLPDLLLQALINPTKIFLHSQYITIPTSIFSLISLVVQVIMTLFLNAIGVAAVFATAFATWIADFVLLMLHVVYIASYCSDGLCASSTTKMFKEWKQLLRFSIPSYLSTTSELWYYAIAELFQLPAMQLSTMTSLNVTDAICYALQKSISSASCIRIANALGAKRILLARKTSHFSLLLGLILGAVAMVGMMTCTFAFISMEMAVIATMEMVNMLKGASAGALLASGNTWADVIATVGSFSIVGLPLILVFKLDVWFIVLVAIVFSTTLNVLAVFKTDWTHKERHACSIHDDNQLQVNDDMLEQLSV